MRKFLPFIICLLSASVQLPAQNVGIGTTTPQSSAILDVTSNSKGFLPPRMTTAERNAIAGKVAGLLIYNTTTSCVEMYNGSSWISLCSSLPSSILPKMLLGSNQEDWANFIQQTADSGYIIGAVTGGTDGNGDVTGINNGNLDCWIIKLSKTGVIEWDKTLGGSENDEIRQIKQTTDGGYIFCASTFSSATGYVTDVNHGLADYWVVKLDANGDITWEVLLGGNQEDFPSAIVENADGTFTAGGYSYSSANGDVTPVNHGNFDYWVVQLSSAGVIQWNVLLGGSGDEFLYGLNKTADGGFIATGYSTSPVSGNVTGTVSGIRDFWVVKLTSAGAITWNRLIGGTGEEEYSYAVQQTADGGYIVAGNSESTASGNISVSTHGLTDFLIVKLNAAGAISWNKMLGGINTESVAAIRQTTDGGYIIAGTTTSSASGDITGTSYGLEDVWVVKTDGSGNVVWDKLLGSNASDFATAIQQTFDGGFIISGFTDGSANGTVSGTNHGANDVWITKLDANGNIL